MLLKECNALLGQQHHALPLVNPLVSPPPASFAELLNWASLECHFPTYSLHNIAAPASGFMILFVDCHLRLLGDRTSLRRRACCESEAGPEAADVREGAANLGLATTHRDCAAIIAGARPGGRHRHSPPTRKLAVLTETYGDCIVPGTTFFFSDTQGSGPRFVAHEVQPAADHCMQELGNEVPKRRLWFAWWGPTAAPSEASGHHHP